MLRVHERKMRLILIFLFVSTISACSSLKQSDYLAPFIKEKPLTVLPEKKAIVLEVAVLKAIDVVLTTGRVRTGTVKWLQKKKAEVKFVQKA